LSLRFVFLNHKFHGAFTRCARHLPPPPEPAGHGAGNSRSAGSPRPRPGPCERPIPIAPRVTPTFLDAGHVLGSAPVVPDTEEYGEKRRLLFSGSIRSASTRMPTNSSSRSATPSDSRTSPWSERSPSRKPSTPRSSPPPCATRWRRGTTAWSKSPNGGPRLQSDPLPFCCLTCHALDGSRASAG